jgi:hypothetical protein
MHFQNKSLFLSLSIMQQIKALRKRDYQESQRISGEKRKEKREKRKEFNT